MPKTIDENRVFEVATALFVRLGYSGTKTQEIAEEAGVNEATLYRRYGNKASLLGKAIDHQWRDVPLAALGPSDDLEGDLVSIVAAYLETTRLRGAIVPALLVELARSDELRGAFGTALSNVGRITAIFQHHQAKGRLRAEEPMTAVTALIGPLMVREMFRRAGIGGGLAAIDTQAYVRAFLEGRLEADPRRI